MKEQIDKWKSALMTMPDNSFFELLRTVFGKIKTPFNKQQLLNDLEIFLLRSDIQNTIAAFIDNNDEKIIAAVALFGEPTPEELERFFADEFSYVQLNDIIVNLEERFLLYRFKDEQKFRLAANPVLENILAPAASNVSALFPPVSASPKTKQGKPFAVINDRILAGLLSFVLQYEGTPFYKREGQLRKQTLDAGKNCFPGLDLEETIGTFQVLGLFYANEDKLYPDKKRFSDIALLSARERMEYYAAGIAVFKGAGKPLFIEASRHAGSYYKNQIKETVSFIHAFIDFAAEILNSPEKEKIFSESNLFRLIEVLKSRTEYNINTNLLARAFLKTEIVIHVSDSLHKINPLLFAVHHSLPSISIDSGFSIFVYPEIDFEDAVKLAYFLNIKEAGAVVRFELEKNSAVRAFDSGYSAEVIIGELNRLSAKKLPDTLAWNLNEWEKRHGEVSLKRGVVLTLTKDKHYLAQTMPLSALIADTLAPGIYLLNENAEEEAAAALRSAGIDIINRGKTANNAGNTARSNASAQNYYSVPSDRLSCRLIDHKTKNIQSNVSNLKNGNIKINDKKLRVKKINDFRLLLEKTALSKTDRDELSARIDRRLILCPAQLEAANIRYEKLEARHMDYTGKLNIAKQAISLDSPVEITWTAEGKEKNIYGIPVALEKEGSELILVVVPEDKNTDIRIPLAKISVLRRIKKSIFESGY